MASKGGIEPGGEGANGNSSMDPTQESGLNLLECGEKIHLKGEEGEIDSADSHEGVRPTGSVSDETNKILIAEFNTDTVDSGYMNTESDLSEELMNVSDGNISMESNANSEIMAVETGEDSQNKENGNRGVLNE